MLLVGVVFVLVIVLGYFYNKGSGGGTSFIYSLDSIYIESRDLRMDYADIRKVEQATSSFRCGFYTTYLITYWMENNRIASLPFDLSMLDKAKWEGFKVKLRAENSWVIIDESFF